MKQYLSNSVIWGPLLSLVMFLFITAIVFPIQWISGEIYMVVSILMSLALCGVNIPVSKDLDFIASSNQTVENYLLRIFKRNLWYHVICLIIASFAWNVVSNDVSTMDVVIMALLMIANSAVVLGLRISRYELIAGYVIALILGALLQNSIYYILLAFIVMGLSFEIYTKTLRGRDLV